MRLTTKFILFSTALLLLAATVYADGNSETDGQGSETIGHDTFSEYRKINIAEMPESYSSLLIMAQEFLTDIRALEYLVELHITRQNSESDLYQVGITTGGYRDDSISGEVFLFFFREKNGLYFLEDGGVQFICGRGSNAGIPQTNYCP